MLSGQATAPTNGTPAKAYRGYDTTERKIMEKMMSINKGSVEQMLFGMNEVCKFMSEDVCGYTADGILSRDKELTEEENAVGYVRDYTDLIHGTFEMMSGVLGIITDGLANNEIEITAK